MTSTVPGPAAVSSSEALHQNASADEFMKAEANYVLQTYKRTPVLFERGVGSKLYDSEGKEYIDMAGGIAVNCLGHSHPAWVAAVQEQAAQLAHVSNIFYTKPMIMLAKKLCDSSFADKVFFCNSGAEANEAAIKFSRKVAKTRFADAAEKPFEIVTFTRSFHGRLMGTLAITYKKNYREPFEPLMPGAVWCDYGDIEGARKAIVRGKTCAVFVEPVQGEGGVFPATAAFLKELRSLCDAAGATLVFDEVQCGLGRTGKLWAHQHYGVTPDILTTAKPLAAGMPIGAVLMTQAVAGVMSYGDHGSTYAGNPLVCHAANVVVDTIMAPGFLDSVVTKGELLRSSLRDALKSSKHCVEVRGSGLLVGIQMDVPAGPVIEAAMKKGVILLSAGNGDVIRMAPPLILTEAEIAKVVSVLKECFAELP
eukprot:jgi/Mesvir1/10999/Mv26128-RA.2